MTLHVFVQRGAVLAAVCAVGISTASAQQGRGQFRGLDRNGDGVITRDEWRGNDRSFRNHDLNGDGVITRDEWRAAEGGPGSGWTSNDFDALDRNHDSRVSRWEWRQGYGAFEVVDRNQDGEISRAEFLGNSEPTTAGYPGYDRNRDGVVSRDEIWAAERRQYGTNWTPQNFSALDRNDDGRISRWEWREGYGQFDRIDRNQDGQISRDEFLGNGEPASSGYSGYDRNRDGIVSRDEIWTAERQRYNGNWTPDNFSALDRNDDGRISRSEWREGYGQFDRIDRNQDGQVTRDEFLGDAWSDTARRPASASQGSAYQTGHERGLQDGRLAGRDDRNRGRWDLDGQRELEVANAGYRNEFGALDQYQAGYREGFMTGYREAFGRGAPGQGAAYRAGREQGLQDGRRAGREDASHHNWDLEGQRELVMADAGYHNGLGSRSEYQVGYREGFKIGYGEGYGRR